MWCGRVSSLPHLRLAVPQSVQRPTVFTELELYFLSLDVDLLQAGGVAVKMEVQGMIVT